MTTTDESSASRRLKGLASAADHKLLIGFGTLLSIYAFVTLAAHNVLPSIQNNLGKDVPFFEQRNNSKNNNNVRDDAVGGISSSPQQQQQQLRIPPKEYYKLSDIKDIEGLQHTFPVHVGDDMEEIGHPGMQFADAQKMKLISKAHNLPSTITVPRFWRPTQYGPGGVRKYLGNYGERLITPEEASKIGSFLGGEDGFAPIETIYVSVASYRDPECTPTIEDLYERAKNPERIRVAIIDQRTDDDPYCTRPAVPCEENPNQTLCRFRHLIDVYEIAAPLSIGPVFARHLANRMYRGEYFAMQVDSHVRFIEHWDDSLVSQWKSAQNEMGIITTYLSDIIGSIDPVTHENRHPSRPIMCKTDYESNGKLRHLRHGQQPEGYPGIHGEPTLHPFWAAGFSFARGHFVVQVPYDQYQPMVFQGEEISIGLRAWTHGYDFYTLEKSVAFHMYAIKENKEKRKKVKLFWENGNLYPGSNIEGMKRLNGIIGMGDPEDEYFRVEEEDYRLGQIRTKEQFFRLYGIHANTKTVEDNLCKFVGKPMHFMFKKHLRENRMGIDFSKIDFEFKDPDKGKKQQRKHMRPPLQPR